MSDADICRANDWRPGDVLEGREDASVSRILILYIGESHLMAKEIWRDGQKHCGVECCWTLSCRPWKLVSRQSFAVRLSRVRPLGVITDTMWVSDTIYRNTGSNEPTLDLYVMPDLGGAAHFDAVMAKYVCDRYNREEDLRVAEMLPMGGL